MILCGGKEWDTAKVEHWGEEREESSLVQEYP